MSSTARITSRTTLCASIVVVALACRTRDGEVRAVPNDNRVAAGRLNDSVLALRLEAREARWYPDGDDRSSLVMPMFAEVGFVRHRANGPSREPCARINGREVPDTVRLTVGERYRLRLIHSDSMSPSELARGRRTLPILVEPARR